MLELDGGVLDGRHPLDGLPFPPVGCCSLSPVGLAAVPPLPFSGVARDCDAWLPPTVASADVSPRSSRFAKSCAALSAGPVGRDGRGKQIRQAWGGLESAPRSPREGICSQRQNAAAERRRRAAQHFPRGAVGRTRVPRVALRTRRKRVGQPLLFERRHYS